MSGTTGGRQASQCRRLVYWEVFCSEVCSNGDDNDDSEMNNIPNKYTCTLPRDITKSAMAIQMAGYF
jgi:hypothetical protein